MSVIAVYTRLRYTVGGRISGDHRLGAPGNTRGVCSRTDCLARTSTGMLVLSKQRDGVIVRRVSVECGEAALRAPMPETDYPSTVEQAHSRGRREEMSLRTLVDERRDAIKDVVARHYGRRVRLFGSVARGEEHEGSDIDLLVEFLPGSSLFDLMHLNRELEQLLEHRVDVVSEGALKHRDRELLDEAAEL